MITCVVDVFFDLRDFWHSFIRIPFPHQARMENNIYKYPESVAYVVQISNLPGISIFQSVLDLCLDFQKSS